MHGADGRRAGDPSPSAPVGIGVIGAARFPNGATGRKTLTGDGPVFLEELQVDGFGPLTGRTYRFKTPVAVVFGPNESGKTSLLRFVRCMLYGFPTRHQPVERGEPVHGGRHGGRLVFAMRDGSRFTLERYASEQGRRGAGWVTLRDERGAVRTMPQAEWERFALGGVSAAMFRQLFAVTLDDLRELEALQSGEAGNYLYHAGMAGGARLTQAIRQLEAELDKLYRPRGSQPAVNAVLHRIRQLEAELRQRRQQAESYNEAARALEAVERDLGETERLLPGAQHRQALLQAAIGVRGWWLDGKLAEREERELARHLDDPDSPPLDGHAAASWKAALRERAQAEEKLEGLRRERLEAEEKLQATEWDGRLAAALPELEELASEAAAVAAKAEEAASLEAEERLLTESIGMMTARISRDWTIRDLEAFGTVAQREDARQIRDAYAKAERELEAAEREILRIDGFLAGARREEETEEAAATGRTAEPAKASAAAGDHPFGAFRPRTRQELSDAWERFEDAVHRLERAKLEQRLLLQGRGARSGPNARIGGRAFGGVLPLVLGAAGMAVLGGAAVLGAAGQSGWPVWLLAGAALLLLAGAVLAGRRTAGGSRGRPGADGRGGETRFGGSDPSSAVRFYEEQAAEALRHLLEHPEAAAARPLEAGPDGAGADGAGPDRAEIAAFRDETRRALREAVRREMERLEELERRRMIREEARRRTEAWLRERDAAVLARDAAAEKLRQLEEDWRGWLRQNRIEESLSPHAWQELFRLAEQGQEALRRLRSVRERLAALERAMADFAGRARAVLAGIGETAEAADSADSSRTGKTPLELARLVQSLHREAVRHDGLRKEAEDLRKRIGWIREREEEALREREAADALLRAMMAEAGVRDEQAYERRLAVDERRRQLLDRVREARTRLEAGRTPEETEALLALLQRHDEAQLERLLREAADRTAELEARRDGLREQKGRLAQEMERLGEEAGAGDIRQRLEEQQAELERLLERYVELAVAAALIRRTRTLFEQERQPEVIRLASRYFARMTEGAYRRVAVTEEKMSLAVETAGGAMVDSAFLSRGTQEQLYLALRLALAETIALPEPLPLLMDDLFVHFDAGRLARTAEVLREIAGGRQVVLFTCHGHVAERVLDALGDRAGLIRLDKPEEAV